MPKTQKVIGSSAAATPLPPTRRILTVRDLPAKGIAITSIICAGFGSATSFQNRFIHRYGGAPGSRTRSISGCWISKLNSERSTQSDAAGKTMTSEHAHCAD